MKEGEARSRAEEAYKEGTRILVLDVATSVFGRRDEDLTALLNAVENEGWALQQIVQDATSGGMRGIFRRAEEHRTLR